MKFVTPRLMLTLSGVLFLALGGGWLFNAHGLVESGVPGVEGNDLCVMVNLAQMFGTTALMLASCLLAARTLEPTAAKKMCVGAGIALTLMAALMVRNAITEAPWGGPPAMMIVIMSALAITLLFLGLQRDASDEGSSQG